MKNTLNRFSSKIKVARERIIGLVASSIKLIQLKEHTGRKDLRKNEHTFQDLRENIKSAKRWIMGVLEREKKEVEKIFENNDQDIPDLIIKIQEFSKR